MENEIERELKNDNDKDVTWGLSRKLVNMAFKYLYIFRNYIEKVNEKSFATCDCPIDSTILEKLEKENNVWSKLQYEDYCKIQDEIKQIIDNDKNSRYHVFDYNCGNLIYDFVNW